jgi:hypothetical protein
VALYLCLLNYPILLVPYRLYPLLGGPGPPRDVLDIRP